MLDGVRDHDDVAMATRQDGRGLWTVTICAADWLGGLSMVSGLFAVNLVDVLAADVFSLVFESDQPMPRGRRRPRTSRRGGRRRRPGTRSEPTRETLSIFQVRSPTEARPDLWSRFEDELSGLAGQAVAGDIETAQGLVIDRFSLAMRDADETQGQLLPIRVLIDTQGSTDSTVLSIRSQDTPGFLFAFTTALTSLKVNIRRAEVRTVHGEVHDTFWLTDASGHKTTSERTMRELRVAAVLIKHFTHLLPRSSNPQLALRQFQALVRQVLASSDWTGEIDALESPKVLGTLADMMGVSQF
jgi:glutamate-ammonia-ligase adenylyltransferase